MFHLMTYLCNTYMTEVELNILHMNNIVKNNLIFLETKSGIILTQW